MSIQKNYYIHPVTKNKYGNFTLTINNETKIFQKPSTPEDVNQVYIQDYSKYYAVHIGGHICKIQNNKIIENSFKLKKETTIYLDKNGIEIVAPDNYTFRDYLGNTKIFENEENYNFKEKLYSKEKYIYSGHSLDTIQSNRSEAFKMLQNGTYNLYEPIKQIKIFEHKTKEQDYVFYTPDTISNKLVTFGDDGLAIGYKYNKNSFWMFQLTSKKRYKLQYYPKKKIGDIIFVNLSMYHFPTGVELGSVYNNETIEQAYERITKNNFNILKQLPIIN